MGSQKQAQEKRNCSRNLCSITFCALFLAIPFIITNICFFANQSIQCLNYQSSQLPGYISFKTEFIIALIIAFAIIVVQFVFLIIDFKCCYIPPFLSYIFLFVGFCFQTALAIYTAYFYLKKVQFSAQNAVDIRFNNGQSNGDIISVETPCSSSLQIYQLVNGIVHIALLTMILCGCCCCACKS